VATSILQSASLRWNNTSNTLSATYFVGSGAGVTDLDYDNISTTKPEFTFLNNQNTLKFTTPLNKDVSNNVNIDLSCYP
jgi:hypothetical protein